MVNRGFGWDYPPGVTEGELAIAGPDYEHETNKPCPYINRWDEAGEPVELECGKPMTAWGYGSSHYLVCDDGHQIEVEPEEQDI